MLKIGAAVNFILAILEGALGCRWICQAEENNWEPKRIFYGITWFLNAIMHSLMGCQLWRAAAEQEKAYFDDADDLDDLDGFGE